MIGFLSRLFGSACEPAVATSATGEYHASVSAAVDESGDDFVIVADPIVSNANSITVHEDFVEAATDLNEPVKPGQAVVVRTSTKIVATLPGPQPQTKVLNAKEAIALLAVMFFDRIPVGRALERYQFTEGLSVLDDCAKFLSTKTYSGYFDIIAVLSQVATDSRWVLSLVLRDFLEDVNWPSTVSVVGYEVHPVVWALLLGPLGLAAGLIEGKPLAKILLEAEDDWIKAYTDKTNFKVKTDELKRFAAALCELGKEALAPPTPVEPEAAVLEPVAPESIAQKPVTQRRAKRVPISTVRVIGPA